MRAPPAWRCGCNFSTALWLEQPQAIALTQSLPLQAEPFGDRACRPFSPDWFQKGNSGSGLPNSARPQSLMTSVCWW